MKFSHFAVAALFLSLSFLQTAQAASCETPKLKLTQNNVVYTLVANACGYELQWLDKENQVISSSYFSDHFLDVGYTGRAYDRKALANIWNTSGIQIRAICMSDAGCPNLEDGAQNADLSGFELTPFAKVMARK